MKITEALALFRERLAFYLSKSEIDFYFKKIISHYFDLEATTLALTPNHVFESQEVKQLKEVLSDLEKQKPLQYILGEADFYHYTFKVSEDVLIPRPETAELIEWVKESYSDTQKTLSLLDIGTGSGCIAVSLALANANFKVYALDKFQHALNIAKENAINLEAKVSFFKHDITQNFQWETPLDSIVSNPPYLISNEKKQMRPNVLDYEPYSALFTPDKNPIYFYEKIVSFAQLYLKKNGYIFFEINPTFVKSIVSLLEENSYSNIEIRKDAYGKERMIKAIKN